MAPAKSVNVRVLPSRSISLGEASFVDGDELELSAVEAEQLIEQGFVCKATDYEKAAAAALADAQFSARAQNQRNRAP